MKTDDTNPLVIWGYDLPPYILFGRGMVQPDGSFIVPSFGEAFKVKRKRVLAVVPATEDIERIVDQIQSIHQQYVKAIAQADGKLTSELIRVVPDLKLHFE